LAGLMLFKSLHPVWQHWMQAFKLHKNTCIYKLNLFKSYFCIISFLQHRIIKYKAASYSVKTMLIILSVTNMELCYYL